MKQVLIIVHLPRASERVVGLVKYLPDFGWRPIVLTGTTSVYRDLPARIVETPYRNALGFLGSFFKLSGEEANVRRQIESRIGISSHKFPIDFFTLAGMVINYPCPDKNWRPFAVKVSDELLQRENIDAIISSSAPVTSHLIANELKGRYKIPWVADFRDLWSQNHNYSYGPLRRALDRRLEIKTLSEADALTTVSKPWADKLSALHRGKTTCAITSGFDPETVNIPPAKLTDKFTITYTGSIYAKNHAPTKLFAALRDLVLERVIEPNDIEVRFYGIMAGWLEKEITRYGLSRIVNLCGKVSKDVSLQKQRESQLLFITKWRDPNERGAHSGKIFEYLAARRPILAADGSVDVVTSLLNETKAGIDALTVEDIKDALLKLYKNYKLEGELAYNGIDSEIDKYSQREMARKFSMILDRLAPNN